MFTTASVLSLIGSILALLVQLGALVWVLVRAVGRPRSFAAAGLGSLIAGTLFQIGWSLGADALVRLDRSIVLLQAGWLFGSLLDLVGVVLLAAAAVAGRALVRADRPPSGPAGGYGPTYPPPGYPGQGPAGG